MAYYNRKRYNKSSKKEEKRVSFACPRKFYSLCSHRLGDGVGLVGLFDKLSPADNIEQGNIEELCLNKLGDLLANVPDNDVEVLKTKIRVFVPDFMSYFLNGDIADFVQNNVRINGEEIAPDLLELMDEVDIMLREKSRNVNIRLYKYQPEDMKDEAQAWFQKLVDEYLNGLKSANSKPAETAVDPVIAKKLAFLEKAEKALEEGNMDKFHAFKELANSLEDAEA